MYSFGLLYISINNIVCIYFLLLYISINVFYFSNRTLSRNIRQRKGSKVEIQVPGNISVMTVLVITYYCLYCR